MTITAKRPSHQLALPREMQVVDLATVQRQPSMTKAIVLCAELGGFDNDKEFCGEVDLDQAVWSQIQNGTRFFPQDKYERLFEACANEVPLIWLADRRGYVLVPKQTEMERRLALAVAERDEERRTNAVLMKAIQGRATG